MTTPDTTNTFVYGTSGDDTISSSAANDTILGFAGNDTISATGEGSVVYGNQGEDSIIAAGGNLHVYGGQSNDYCEINGDNAYVVGNLGNDIINIAFVPYSSADFSQISSHTTVLGGNGSDQINIFSADSLIYGNQDNDLITLNDPSHSLVGHNTVYGGQGNDTVTDAANLSYDVIYGNLGKDYLSINGSNTAYGGQDNDTLQANLGGIIYGNSGDDFLDLTGNASKGATALAFGGQGNDEIFFEGLGDTAFGNLGTDEFSIRSTSLDVSAVSTVDDFRTGEDHIDFVNGTKGSATNFQSARITGDDYDDALGVANKVFASSQSAAYVFVAGQNASYLFTDGSNTAGNDTDVATSAVRLSGLTALSDLTSSDIFADRRPGSMNE
jgi:Ca2+-binding RTX toxin-like protein